jgi:hypothetical protein
LVSLASQLTGLKRVNTLAYVMKRDQPEGDLNQDDVEIQCSHDNTPRKTDIGPTKGSDIIDCDGEKDAESPIDRPPGKKVVPISIVSVSVLAFVSFDLGYLDVGITS